MNCFESVSMPTPTNADLMQAGLALCKNMSWTTFSITDVQARSILSELEAKTKQVEALREAAKQAAFLLTGYHTGYIGINADGHAIFDNYDVCTIGHDLNQALALCEPPASGREEG